jgi:hypothetical protein
MTVKRPTAGRVTALVLVTGVLGVGCGGDVSAMPSPPTTTQAPTGVLVPNVVGLSFQAASNRLRSAGFQMIDGVVSQTCARSQDGIVSSQAPRPNTRRPAGMRIRLTAYVYEAEACAEATG